MAIGGEPIVTSGARQWYSAVPGKSGAVLAFPTRSVQVRRMTTETPAASGEVPPPSVDLAAYVDRIGFVGKLEPTPAVLAALHLAHATRIPFENLDVLLGRPIRLDLESLQAKLVRDRRGGYCFEQNLLFAAVLEQIGFAVARLAARVRYGTTRLLPRTHMLMQVHLGRSAWLADVGYGAEGLLLPIPFDPAKPSRQFAWTYRVVDEAGQWVLQSLHGPEWIDLYGFTLEPQLPLDYELPNYYVSTHPDSRFVQTLTAQRVTPDARYVLRNRELSETRGGDTTSRTLAGDDELLAVLAGTFGLSFPAGTRFPFQKPTA
jgi:N-hydroxyarylamine O-acetyltransferase